MFDTVIDTSYPDRSSFVVNIQEVARRAGVSTATVSRYLAGEHVRRAEAVAAAVLELDYRPSPTARGLRMGRHLAVGVVVPDIANPFFAWVTRGIENVLAPAGLQVALSNSDESVQREAELVADLQRRVDGVILAPATETDSVPDYLAAAGTPVVFIDRGLRENTRFDVVEVDNSIGAAAVATHLAELGHRSIGMISGPLTSTPGRERHEGFLSRLGDLGHQIQPAHIVVADFKESGGKLAMVRLLDQAEPPTGVFVANNLMSIGALKAVREMGLRIPHDISVVGFDDLDLGPLLDPPFTVIERPTVTQGEVAARLMLERLRDPQRPQQSVVLPVQLIVRASTAAPHRRTT